MEPIKSDTEAFSIGDANFVIDITPGYNRRPSDNSAFTLVKTPAYINRYIGLSKSLKPSSILELGIFQGGSYVLLDSLFQPDAMSGVEISSKPVVPLEERNEGRSKRKVHYGKSQTDEALLRTIVRDEFGGTLDMVVDDASHLYEETRRSFEVLFPLLSPGGHYIVEDWAWAHKAPYQGEKAAHANKAAMTNLIFEIIALQGSGNLITEVRVYPQFFMVRKSAAAPSTDEFWNTTLLRGKEFVHI